MYSSKISPDLIPILYTIAKTNKKLITKIVDSILREHLKRSERTSLINQSKAYRIN